MLRHDQDNHFIGYHGCHSIVLSEGHIKATNGEIVVGPFNENIDFSVIQLNHYKSKTLPEFRAIRTRGRAGIPVADHVKEDIDNDFIHYDINEVEDLCAYNFAKANGVWDMKAVPTEVAVPAPSPHPPVAKPSRLRSLWWTKRRLRLPAS